MSEGFTILIRMALLIALSFLGISWIGRVAWFRSRGWLVAVIAVLLFCAIPAAILAGLGFWHGFFLWASAFVCLNLWIEGPGFISSWRTRRRGGATLWEGPKTGTGIGHVYAGLKAVCGALMIFSGIIAPDSEGPYFPVGFAGMGLLMIWSSLKEILNGRRPPQLREDGILTVVRFIPWEDVTGWRWTVAGGEHGHYTFGVNEGMEWNPLRLLFRDGYLLAVPREQVNQVRAVLMEQLPGLEVEVPTGQVGNGMTEQGNPNV